MPVAMNWTTALDEFSTVDVHRALGRGIWLVALTDIGRGQGGVENRRFVNFAEVAEGCGSSGEYPI